MIQLGRSQSFVKGRECRGRFTRYTWNALLLVAVVYAAGCGGDEPTVFTEPRPDPKVWTVLDAVYDASPGGGFVAFMHRNLSDFRTDTYMLTMPNLEANVLFAADTLDASGLRFSPDGTRVAFVRDATRDIYVANLQTGMINQVTFTNGNARDPDWDPTGKYIVYVRPFLPYGQPAALSGIFIVDTEALIDHPLTHDGQPTFGGNPRWSPDGSAIVFSYGVQLNPPARTPMAIHIFRVNVDGSGYADLNPGDTRNNSYPVWLSGGKEVMYESYDAHTFAIHETRVMNQDGSNVRKLGVELRPYINAVAISRDETYFIFSAPDSTDRYLVLYKQGLKDASGTSRVQLTTVPPGAEVAPALGGTFSASLAKPAPG